jgi:hypothetical protein
MKRRINGKNELKKESVPYCEKCGRRKAVLRRFYSGEKYCLSCLSEVLRKRVKRNLSRSNLLSPGITVGVMIPPNFLAEGLLGLSYLREIERKYNSSVYPILFATEDSRSIIELYENVLGEEFFVIFGWEKVLGKARQYGLVGLWLALKDILLYKSGLLNINVFTTPACHEFLVQLDLSAFLQSKWGFLCNSSLSSTDISGNKIFLNLFHGVPCSETSILSYYKYPFAFQYSLTSAQRLYKTPYDNYAWSILVDAVGTSSGEMLYSIEKSARWIADTNMEKPCIHKSILPQNNSLLGSLGVKDYRRNSIMHEENNIFP